MKELTEKTEEWDLNLPALALALWAILVLFTNYLSFGYFPYADTGFKVIAVISLLALALHKK